MAANRIYYFLILSPESELTRLDCYPSLIWKFTGPFYLADHKPSWQNNYEISSHLICQSQPFYVLSLLFAAIFITWKYSLYTKGSSRLSCERGQVCFAAQKPSSPGTPGLLTSSPAVVTPHPLFLLQSSSANVPVSLPMKEEFLI